MDAQPRQAALPRPACSVVVPAHDEANVIAERLAGLLPAASAGDIEITVVANGCTDDTARVARSLPGVHVLELAEASKTAALNAGDRASSAHPRIYLDADVRLDGPVLGDLVEALTTDRPVVAAPSVTFDSSSSTWPVRAFYSIFERLPYATEGLIGLGVYGLSAEGRRRFGDFPAVVADDLYVQRLFEPSERLTVDGTFGVMAPRDLHGLIAVRTRVARGNRELADRADLAGSFVSTTAVSLRALVRLVTARPALLPAAAVYAAVTFLARNRAGRATVGTSWERDTSSRRSMAAPDRPGRVLVDGVSFDPLTEPELVRTVMERLRSGRGGSIITPNVDIHRLLRRSENADLATQADIVVADGMPIIWASRLSGQPLPERVAGATLVWSLARAAAAENRSVFLLGAAPEVAAEAAQRLSTAVPGLGSVGWHSPPYGFESVPDCMAKIVASLEAARPDIVYVAMGFPRQERLMAQMRSVLPGSWLIGCGGSVDMIAGRRARAPMALQRLGLEWLFRLAQEPRRLFKRYVVDDVPHAVLMLGRSAGARRRHARERARR